MRALTLRQPWAHLVAHEGKNVENRSWAAPSWLLGEWVAIHAGQALEADRVGLVRSPPAEWPSGIVAIARVAGCAHVDGEARGDINPRAVWSSEWFLGPWGWLLTDVVALPRVVKCSGAQGLWRIGPRRLARVMAGLEFEMRHGASVRA